MKERNRTVDVIRGVAMLLVVLGHTLPSTVSNYSNGLLFQIIWTLQMPLFIIISGYVTRFSHPLINGNSYCFFKKKRSLAYLLPWFVWTILVRGLIFGQTEFLNLKFLFWHMDSGYWFLITIWTISMIFGLSDFLSNIICKKNRVSNALFHFVFCVIGIVVLAAFGKYVGVSFFAIKLTLYYMPFFLLGYLYGVVQDWLMTKENAKTIINCTILISLGVWLAAITRYDFFAGGDGIKMIIERFFTSILGCIAIIGLISESGIRNKFINWVGVHSLEIYLTHYLYLGLVPALGLPALSSMEGLLSLVLNYLLTILLVTITIKLLQGNNLLNFMLYAKKEKISS